MIPLIKLKRDVQFNGELTKVVDVLKGIAASRYYVLERQMTLFEQFFQVCEEFFSSVDVSRLDHPFVRPAGPETAVLMVTTDAGFLGGLNTQVVNAGLKAGGAGAQYAVIGERGASALRDMKIEFTAFPGIQDSGREELAFSIRDHLIRQVLTGRCARVVVIYPKPVSFSVQEVTVETLIPFGASRPPEGQARGFADLLWESRPEDVVEYVVIQWMGHHLSALFAWSRLAELSARSIHLEGSFQELNRIGKRLKHEYFRARHEVIDRSMREIFAAQLLYGKQREE
ncbi:MAG: F0F1 ATP synthase subunit gamma [Candidatus Omnitrophica bacterium]|nr:F0F1 ATP synthase subunit gamma [Candidatus Omnitrophota bacterium]